MNKLHKHLPLPSFLHRKKETKTIITIATTRSKQMMPPTTPPAMAAIGRPLLLTSVVGDVVVGDVSASVVGDSVVEPVIMFMYVCMCMYM